MSGLSKIADAFGLSEELASVQNGLSTVKSMTNSFSSSVNSAKSQLADIQSKAQAFSDKIDAIGDEKEKKLLENICKDVDMQYDKETKTFTISSGEIDAKTAKAISKYFQEADGKYDDANIVIGSDVTFKKDTVLTRDPQFKDITCNRFEIQSQNIITADHMFRDVHAKEITVASQPGLEGATGMFEGCEADSISVGEIPAGISRDDLMKGCDCEISIDDSSSRVDRGVTVDADLGQDYQCDTSETMQLGD